MRIRIKDTNGIIKSYHTQRYKTIRRGFLEVLSKELGTKTFQIQIQDYNCGWSDWVSVDLNVIDKETLAIPSLTNTLSPLDLGGSDVLNFNTNNPKIIENLYNENDLTVKLTNTQLSLSGYTQGTYNLKIKNYKSYDDDDCVRLGYADEFSSKRRKEQYVALGKLLQLRDYWVKDYEFEDAIRINVSKEGVIVTTECGINDGVLTFPTQEIANEFIDCFKDLLYDAMPLV